MATNASYLAQIRVATNALLDARQALKALIEADTAATQAGAGIVAGLQAADFTTPIAVPAPPTYTRPLASPIANADLAAADIVNLFTALKALEVIFTNQETGLPTATTSSLAKLRY